MADPTPSQLDVPTPHPHPGRNRVARLPWAIRLVACRLLFDGASNAQIDRACRLEADEVGVFYQPLTAPSLAAYKRGPEYERYASHRRCWEAEQAESRSLWAALADEDATPNAVQAARYLGLREIVRQLQSGELSPGDTSRLTTAINRLQTDVLQDAKREWATERKAIEAARDAALAEANHLRDVLAAHGIDPDHEATREGAGLSPAALRQIEERARLL
jgi:hypothetical protein